MSGWYRADVGRHTHRKIRRLARELGVHTMHAVGIHDSLCAMVAEADADDGALGSITADDIAAEVEWEGDPARLFEALLRAGVIDFNEDERPILHGFAERSGASVRKAKNDRARIQDFRSSRAGVAGESRGRSTSVARASHTRTNVRTYEQIPPKPPAAEADLEPVLRESIEQEKAKKAEQLTLANPEPSRRPLVAFVEAWNKGVAGTSIPKAIVPGDRSRERDKRLGEATLRFPEPEAWFWCAKALGGSPGHNGRGTTGWKADLPWILERGNGAKLEQWMARGEELRRSGGKVAPLPVPGERGDERTVRAANAYREEQQRKHEEIMARTAPTDPDPETTKKGLALVREMLPQFRRPEGPK